MNQIQKNILQNIVQPAIRNSITTRLCEVVDYNPKGTIDVKILNASSEQESIGDYIVDSFMKDILVINSSAIKDEVPEPGDIVYIDLINGDRKRGVLLSLLKRNISSDRDKTGGSISMPLSSQAPPCWR